MKIIKFKNENYTSAKELYQELGIRMNYSVWINANLKRAFLEEGKDFIRLTAESTGGRPSIDFLLKKDSAISLIIMSGGEKAKDLRSICINLFNQHDSGKAFTNEQIEALIDLSKSMTLVSIQKDVERKHYDLYGKPETWWNYRAGLLGYSKDTLIDAMKKVNKQHKSIRESLVKLDANELVRTGIIDLFKALGKTDEFAINTGDLCKSIAQKMDLGNAIWDDIKPNPLGINRGYVQEKKELFNHSLKSLNQ